MASSLCEKLISNWLWAQLRGDDVRRHALLVGTIDHFVQHRCKARQPLDVHVRLVVVVVGRLVAWVLWQAVIELAVEQVELQLEGHHRANAAPGQALDHQASTSRGSNSMGLAVPSEVMSICAIGSFSQRTGLRVPGTRRRAASGSPSAKQ